MRVCTPEIKSVACPGCGAGAWIQMEALSRPEGPSCGSGVSKGQDRQTGAAIRRQGGKEKSRVPRGLG